MRFGSDALRGILTGSFDHRWVADVFYDGVRRLADLPIDDVRFSEDADATIQQSGSCRVVWSDEFASSVAPVAVSDMLAPFGAQLAVYSVVTAGEFEERVEYGRFEITNVPDAVDERMLFRDGWITVGSTVELELKELLAGVSQESFDVPSAAPSLTSVWDEVARISGLQITQTVTDVPITKQVAYPENVLDAVYDLMDVVLAARPHMTADGTLSARPVAASSTPVDTIRRGESGTLVEVGAEMSAAGVYNRVVVRSTGADQARVLASAQLASGPLRVKNSDGSVSPFRTRTRYLSSEYVTTGAQAQAWADRALVEESQLSQQVPVVEVFNPLRERGDVVEIETPTQWVLGRVVTINRGGGGTQELRVAVLSKSANVWVRPEPWPDLDTGVAYPASDLFPSTDFFPVGV